MSHELIAKINGELKRLENLYDNKRTEMNDLAAQMRGLTKALEFAKETLPPGAAIPKGTGADNPRGGEA
jgi:hypothetical protein